MGKTIRVEVAAEDIAKGERNNYFACPVALALKRACGVSNAAVRPRRISIWNTGEFGCSVATPPSVRSFFEIFDAGLTVKPFAFDLELP